MSYDDRAVLEQQRRERIRDLGFLCYNIFVNNKKIPDFLKKEIARVKACSEELVNARKGRLAAFETEKKEQALEEAILDVGYTCYNFYVDGRGHFDETAQICKEIRSLNDKIMNGANDTDTGTDDDTGNNTGTETNEGTETDTGTETNTGADADTDTDTDTDADAGTAADAGDDNEVTEKKDETSHTNGEDKKEYDINDLSFSIPTRAEFNDNTAVMFSEMPSISRMPQPKVLNKHEKSIAEDVQKAHPVNVDDRITEYASVGMGYGFGTAPPQAGTADPSFKMNFPYGMEPIPEGFIKCKCGYRNRFIANYCGKCGKKLSRRKVANHV